jgi:hypothetical protein
MSALPTSARSYPAAATRAASAAVATPLSATRRTSRGNAGASESRRPGTTLSVTRSREFTPTSNRSRCERRLSTSE